MNFYRSTTRIVVSGTFTTAMVLSLMTGLSAEEKQNRKSNKTQAKQSITDIEAAIQAPSRLSFAESKRITLGDLFQKVATEHGIQVRVDKNLAAILAVGREAMLVAEGDIPGGNNSNSNQKIATGMKIPFPIQLAPVYSGSELIVSSPSQLAPSGYAQPSPSPLNGNAHQPAIAYPQPVSSDQPPNSTYSLPANPSQTLPQPTYLSGDVQYPQPGPQGTIQAQKPVVNEDQDPTEKQIPETEEIEESAEAKIQQNLQMSSRAIEMLLETEITTIGLTQSNASLESVLLHALDHVTTLLDVASVEGEMTFPFSATHAYDLTLLLKKDHVLVTTVAAANLQKTTKVYAVAGLGDIDAEALSNVITKTIRPWSWRSQINSLVDQVSADWPESVSIPKIKIDLTGVSTSESSENKSDSDSTEVDLTSLKTMGQLLSSGTIAAAHTMISGTEMLHHADPPTADIETLPGMLIITQSQGAHREIHDLITQLKSVNQESE